MSNIPTTQKAIRIHETGGPEVIKYEEIPVPEISETQVLVKNEYTGINFIEAYFREGTYKAELPLTLGREGAGEVVKVGAKVSKYSVGDKIGYMGNGAYCDYIALEESGNIANVSGLSTKEVAGSLLQGLTAYALTTKTHPIKKGEYVLVHAAAGGTGSIVVQLANHFGATVIGTTSTAEKAEIAKKAGAHHVINYKEEDVVARVQEITNKKGVSVSFDSVGKATWDISLQSLGKLGHLVSFGNASGVVEPFSILTLSPKSLSVTRPVLNNYVSDSESWDNLVKGFYDLVASGVVKVSISKVYPIKDFSQALSDLQSGKTTGKLLTSHI